MLDLGLDVERLRTHFSALAQAKQQVADALASSESSAAGLDLEAIERWRNDLRPSLTYLPQAILDFGSRFEAAATPLRRQLTAGAASQLEAFLRALETTAQANLQRVQRLGETAEELASSSQKARTLFEPLNSVLQQSQDDWQCRAEALGQARSKLGEKSSAALSEPQIVRWRDQWRQGMDLAQETQQRPS